MHSLEPISLFTKQPGFCCICGKPGKFALHDYTIPCCSDTCRQEYQWRKTLFLSGREYYPFPRKEQCRG